MAYVLGFWFADGYMRHEKSYRIVFCSNDYDLLLQIKRKMGSTHLIYKRKRGSKFQWRNLQLIIYSKQIFLRLMDLGGIRKKSKKIRFPQVNYKYLPDFIRGYFDGDGSVFYVNYIHTKNKKLRQELRSNFTSGSPKFLEDLQDILLNTLGFIKKKICPYDNGASWKLGYGTKDTLKLLQFMYYSNYPIALERKAVFLKEIER